MDCFQVLPLDEEFPFPDLKQMDCSQVVEHPAPMMRQVVSSGHQLLNLEQVLKSSSLVLQFPLVLLQPRLQLQARQQRSFWQRLLAWQLFWFLQLAWHQERQRVVFWQSGVRLWKIRS